MQAWKIDCLFNTLNLGLLVHLLVEAKRLVHINRFHVPIKDITIQLGTSHYLVVVESIATENFQLPLPGQSKKFSHQTSSDWNYSIIKGLMTKKFQSPLLRQSKQFGHHCWGDRNFLVIKPTMIKIIWSSFLRWSNLFGHHLCGN